MKNILLTSAKVNIFLPIAVDPLKVTASLKFTIYLFFLSKIGVGIAGEEGVQAVMASDFVLGRFYFLRRLLLLHGFWCYERISRMILYFFYKNAVSVIDKTQNAFQGITSCVEVFQDTFYKVALKICFLENYIHRYLYLLLLEFQEK